MITRFTHFFVGAIVLGAISASAICANKPAASSTPTANDSIQTNDSVMPARYTQLTPEDYAEVAKELGVDVAAIKAVVEIEAGHAHRGFWAPGKPIINFDLTMFKRFASKKGINLSQYARSHAVVFQGPNSRLYGSQQAGQQARLDAAMTINRVAAIEGTFWGMFQIGGFNWKICGCSSIDQFVERMSNSERDQLELFAQLIKHSGMDKYLRAHNWSGFAARYNGPSYAAHGYHTKMARAYAKYSR